jgi:hypothetical protein
LCSGFLKWLQWLPGHEVLYSHSRSGAKIAALILELLVSRLEFETAAPLCFTLGIPRPALGSLG